MKYNVGDIVKVPWGQLAMITETYNDNKIDPCSGEPYTGYAYKVRFLGRTGNMAFIEKDLRPLLEVA